jgi:hypothetical protein
VSNSDTILQAKSLTSESLNETRFAKENRVYGSFHKETIRRQIRENEILVRFGGSAMENLPEEAFAGCRWRGSALAGTVEAKRCRRRSRRAASGPACASCRACAVAACPWPGRQPSGKQAARRQRPARGDRSADGRGWSGPPARSAGGTASWTLARGPVSSDYPGHRECKELPKFIELFY